MCNKKNALALTVADPEFSVGSKFSLQSHETERKFVP